MLVLSLGAAFYLSEADIGGSERKLFFDLILLFESFWIHLLMLLWAYELCKEEEILFLARLPLSTPLSRTAYELNRFASLAAAFLPIVLIISALNLAIAPIFVVWQGIMFCFSAILCGFFVLTLSRFFAPISAVLYSAAILIIGNGLDDLYIFVTLRAKVSDAAKTFAEILYLVFPNFSVFDHQSEAVTGVIGQGVADSPFVSAFVSFWFVPIVYSVFLGTALCALAAWRFKRLAI
ncbi:hypothetical protein FACS189487_08460 [Campylobacterota bacterium]|nr:hypothetical protein FACS189487_08460 [Campylobacterota bacterium]